MTTIVTESGATKVLPTHVNLEIVCGLDEDGRIVVDQFDSLAGDGPFLFGLTLCCDVYDKGGEDGIYCRACYGDADVGNYLHPNPGPRSAASFPTLDPIKEVLP